MEWIKADKQEIYRNLSAKQPNIPFCYWFAIDLSGYGGQFQPPTPAGSNNGIHNTFHLVVPLTWPPWGQQHNARNKSKLHKYFKRTNYLKYTLRNKGINLWNELAPKFKGIKITMALKFKSNNISWKPMKIVFYNQRITHWKTVV